MIEIEYSNFENIAAEQHYEPLTLLMHLEEEAELEGVSLSTKLAQYLNDHSLVN